MAATSVNSGSPDPLPRPRCLYCQRVIVQVRGRGRPRKFCDDKCMRRYHRTSPCEQCGTPSWNRICQKCNYENFLFARHQAMAIFWNQILDLRREGLLNWDIAIELKRSYLSVNSAVSNMRHAGIRVPKSSYDRAGWMNKYYLLQAAKKRNR